MAKPPVGNRKRQRSNFEEEISEFTPLSKRINNLRINNSLFKEVQQHGELHKSDSRELGSERLNEFDCGSSRNIDSDLNVETASWNTNCYNPDLTPAENPYYYESNRLLFQLYLERSQRVSSNSNLQPPNHF